jgi:hypothetical protein
VRQIALTLSEAPPAVPAPDAGGVFGGQRLRDGFEALPLSLDPEEYLGHPAQDHQDGADRERCDGVRYLARADQEGEDQRAADAARGSAERVEERDRQCPRLHREDLADREVRRAGSGRREEEHDAPARGHRRRVQ